MEKGTQLLPKLIFNILYNKPGVNIHLEKSGINNLTRLLLFLITRAETKSAKQIKNPPTPTTTPMIILLLLSGRIKTISAFNYQYCQQELCCNRRHPNQRNNHI